MFPALESPYLKNIISVKQILSRIWSFGLASQANLAVDHQSCLELVHILFNHTVGRYSSFYAYPTDRFYKESILGGFYLNCISLYEAQSLGGR